MRKSLLPLRAKIINHDAIRKKHKPNHKNNQTEKRQAKGYLLLILLLEYYETALISKSKCMVA